jgi:hypothetical protein
MSLLFFARDSPTGLIKWSERGDYLKGGALCD